MEAANETENSPFRGSQGNTAENRRMTEHAPAPEEGHQKVGKEEGESMRWGDMVLEEDELEKQPVAHRGEQNHKHAAHGRNSEDHEEENWRDIRMPQDSLNSFSTDGGSSDFGQTTQENRFQSTSRRGKNRTTSKNSAIPSNSQNKRNTAKHGNRKDEESYQSGKKSSFRVPNSGSSSRVTRTSHDKNKDFQTHQQEHSVSIDWRVHTTPENSSSVGGEAEGRTGCSPQRTNYRRPNESTHSEKGDKEDRHSPHRLSASSCGGQSEGRLEATITDRDKDVLVVENVTIENRDDSLKKDIEQSDHFSSHKYRVIWHSVDVAVAIVESAELGKLLFDLLSKKNYKVSYYFERRPLPAPRSEAEVADGSPQKKGVSHRLLIGALGGRRSVARSADEATLRSVTVARKELEISSKQRLEGASDSDAELANEVGKLSIREQDRTLENTKETRKHQTQNVGGQSKSDTVSESDVVVVTGVSSNDSETFKPQALREVLSSEANFSVIWHGVDTAVIVTESANMGSLLKSKLLSGGFAAQFYAPDHLLPAPRTKLACAAETEINAKSTPKGPSKRLLMGALGGRKHLARSADDATKRAIQLARNELRDKKRKDTGGEQSSLKGCNIYNY